MFNFANGFNYIHFDIFDIWITKEKLHQDFLRYKLLKNLRRIQRANALRRKVIKSFRKNTQKEYKNLIFLLVED